MSEQTMSPKHRKTVHWRSDVTTPKSNDLPKKNQKMFPKEKFSVVKEIQPEIYPNKIRDQSPRTESHLANSNSVQLKPVKSSGNVQPSEGEGARDSKYEDNSVNQNRNNYRIEDSSRNRGNSYNDVQQRAVNPELKEGLNRGENNGKKDRRSDHSAAGKYVALSDRTYKNGRDNPKSVHRSEDSYKIEQLVGRDKTNPQTDYPISLNPTFKDYKTSEGEYYAAKEGRSAGKESKDKLDQDLRRTPRSPGDGSSHDNLLLDNLRNHSAKQEKLPLPSHISTLRKPENDSKSPRQSENRPVQFRDGNNYPSNNKKGDFDLTTPRHARSDIVRKDRNDRTESYKYRSKSVNNNSPVNGERYTGADNGQTREHILTQEKVKAWGSRNQSSAFSTANNLQSEQNALSVASPVQHKSNYPSEQLRNLPSINLPKLRDYLELNESPSGVLGRTGEGELGYTPTPRQASVKVQDLQNEKSANGPKGRYVYVGNTDIARGAVHVQVKGVTGNEAMQVNNSSTPSPMEHGVQRRPRVSNRSDPSQADVYNTGSPRYGVDIGGSHYAQEHPYQNDNNSSSYTPRPKPRTRVRGNIDSIAEDALLGDSVNARRKLFNPRDTGYNQSLDSGSESELQDLYDDSDREITEPNVNDIYLCYLVTEHGATIGPLRLDIDNVDIGLPESPTGLRNRQTGSQSQNEFSSRSHSMLTLNLDTDVNYPDDDNLYVTKRGKLSFVDLAGSEKVKDSQTGETLLESNSINKSLLVLGNCISSLGNPKRREGHIPYRDSKLTKLLADSLGGNGVTLMIACVTPSSNNTMETMNTLRYANRAKKIKSKPVVKMDPREKLILTLKREIKVLRNENHYLRQQLEFPAKPKGQLQKENDERLVQFMKEQKQKSGGKPIGAETDSGLYEMLQEYMVENESLRADNSDLQSSKDRLRREQQLLYRENDKLVKRVEVLEKTVLGNQGPLPYRMSPVSLAQSGGLSSYENSPLHSPSPQQRKNGKITSRSSSLGTNNGAVVADGAEFGFASSPTGRRLQGQMKPPHRLSEPLIRSTQGNYDTGRGNIHPAQMGPVQPPEGYVMPPHQGHAVPPYQGYPTHHPQGPGSPRLAKKVSPPKVGTPRSNNKVPDQSKDDLQDMNEKLKRELAELEGEIKQQQQLQRSKPNYSGGPGVR